MIRFGTGMLISGMALALTLSAAAQNRSSLGPNQEKNTGPTAPAESSNGMENGDGDLETQIQQLRQMLLEQSRQIAAQQDTIREQQDKMEALASAVAATRAGNPVTIQPAVYAAGSAVSMVAPPPQITRAAGFTPPDNTPKIAVGTTLYPNFTFQEHPTISDADGNVVHKSSFDVGRAYLNITGNISHVIAFRLTPDISRETNTASSLAGSLEFRIKYAFLQANLDDWMTRGSWVRLGIQQTPYVDFMEGIYRYRFQGTIMAERAGTFPHSSSDAGASFHYNLPSNYGDLHAGIYNGENYNKAEVSDQKAFEARLTLRPFATQSPVLRGLRLTGFIDGDHYMTNDKRQRFFTAATFEHKYLVAAFEYLMAHDQTSKTLPSVTGRGYSIWATPRTGNGWEALLRYDHLIPNTSSAFVTGSTAPDATTTFESQRQNRYILGLAYWFPHEGSVSSAILLDWDAQVFRNIANTQPVRTLGVHALINY